MNMILGIKLLSAKQSFLNKIQSKRNLKRIINQNFEDSRDDI